MMKVALTMALAMKGSGLAVAAPVTTSGTCSDGSEWTLEAERDGPDVDLEFEVESFAPGEQWRVFMRQDNGAITRWRRTSRGVDGTFFVERDYRNRAGDDLFEAVAIHRATGEICWGSLTWTQ